MTGVSFGIRTGSYGSLQQLSNGGGGGGGGGGALQNHAAPVLLRKPSKLGLSGYREKEKFLPFVRRYLGRKRVAMVLLVALALLVFVFGSFTVNKEGSGPIIDQYTESMIPFVDKGTGHAVVMHLPRVEDRQKGRGSLGRKTASRSGGRSRAQPPPVPARSHRRARPHPPSRSDPTSPKPGSVPMGHQCKKFAFPPPPPADGKRIGPRPCPVCYVPVEQAIASMPSSPAISPVLRNLTYIHDEDPVKSEQHGVSDFGGYPSLTERDDSFDIKESMRVHCGFVKGHKPGHQTGFDIDEADLEEMEQYHDVIVASAIFGNYDIIQEPRNISEAAKKNIPFFMFIDEETEAYMQNSSVLNSSRRVGLWKIIVVHNIPYADARRNGKIPKLLLHRLFPNVHYSIWVDGKLQLVVDPYQILERFLWRENASFAISRHYRRFDVFEEAEANKAAGKYDNASIDSQIEFYKREGLTPYSVAKLPITSDVPEGCVIMREHIPITNLFTCLWFNEVDRFTARDQLSFSTVRDKIMAKADWSINMFLDCERRNFVIQAYHRDLLEQMPPPASPAIRARLSSTIISTSGRRAPVKKGISSKRSKSDRRRHRKVTAGTRDRSSF
ncbi:hypothetical protein ACJRO7_023159 [Eucalyptus globulus]|uniref:TOD1/MUCI70 glycosyltransferase-like domain-containing protein n=1 Tax=Eucalyptus globulus TaxID=34317 RepID=A0ABD3K6Q1_EUCGL